MKANTHPEVVDLEEAAAERLTPPVHGDHRRSDPEHLGHDHDDGEHDDNDGHEHSETVERRELARIAFVVIAAAVVWFRLWEPLGRLSVIGLLGMVVGGWPILAEAWEN